MSEEDAIRWLIDEAFKAAKMMIRTHLKDDIIRFIILAQTLELHGYTMIWVKGRGVVGATKGVKGRIINATKEIQHHADQRTNGSSQPLVS